MNNVRWIQAKPHDDADRVVEWSIFVTDKSVDIMADDFHVATINANGINRWSAVPADRGFAVDLKGRIIDTTQNNIED